MCTRYPIINRVSELKVHIELTRFVQPEKIEIDANERAVNEKSQYCFFVCTTFDSFLNDLSDLFGKTEVPDPASYADGFNDVIANSGIGDGVGSIDDNTGKIKDSLDVTEEDLKYLRDIAEQEAINRFTTAEINVDMSGMQNTVNSGDDIDGFMTKLTDSVNEAVDNMTEGVHE